MLWRPLYLLLVFMLPLAVGAQWIGDPAQRKPLSTIPQVSEKGSFMVPDGQGGAIMIIETDDNKILAQRVGADGLIMWGGLSAPVVLCQGDSIREVTAAIADGNGGAIIGWRDGRFSNTALELYVQKINAAGQIMWTANGVRVTNTSAIDEDPIFLASDGAGGAIAAWGANNKVSDYQSFAQRFDGATGQPLWTIGGVQLITAAGFRIALALVSDGAGGAIVAMADSRNDANGTNYALATDFNFRNIDLYGQRLNANGSRQWGNNGAALVMAANEQLVYSNTMLPDGQGGAILFYEDYRNDVVVGGITAGENVDVFAQRVNGNGQAQWGGGGVVVTAAAGNQFIGLSFGNAVVLPGNIYACTWSNLPGVNEDVFAQAFNISGTKQWAAEGVMVVPAGSDVYLIDHAAVANSLGELVVVYEVETSFDPLVINVRAQKISGAGQKLWANEGVAVSSVSRVYSSALEAVPSLSGSVIGAWDDEVSNNDFTRNIYGARINVDGSLASSPPGGPFITADAGNWNNPAIWQGGAVPTPGSTVFVRHSVQVTANASVKTLTVEQGNGKILLNPGVVLQVTGQ